MAPQRPRRSIPAFALAAGFAMAAQALAAVQEGTPPDPEELRPGLVSRHRGPSEPGGDDPSTIDRLDPSLVFDWGDASPDLRLPSARFSSSWTGWLLIRERGAYRLRVDADGPATLTLGEHRIAGNGGGPVRSPELFLDPGLVPIRLDYERGSGPSGRLVVDWEGPGFGFEHLPPHLLFHRAEDSPPIDPFEAGRRVADRLGCANCHSEPALPAHPGLGPSLESSRDLHADWLVDWLADPSRFRPGSPMPGFGLGRSEAADIAAFLKVVSAEAVEADLEARMALNVADPGRGLLLFRSAGCLGCHPAEGHQDAPSLPIAPDLSDLGTKRSIGSIAAFLGGSRRLDPGRHRPALGLSSDSAAHLASYLASSGLGPEPPPEASRPQGDPDRGKALVQSLRCSSCHEVPGLDPVPEQILPLPGADPRGGCLAEAPPRGSPRFAIDGPQREHLRAFVAGLPRSPTPPAPWTLAEDAIRRRNCLGCHSRHGEGGELLGARLAALLAEDRELNTLKGTLTPPDLSSVGAKLRPDYLALAVRGQAPTARPWLSTRMPRYAFEPGEAEAITSYLEQFDGVAASPGVEDPPAGLSEAVGIGLLGREGFGCLSCHVLDGKVPPGGEPETLGPDLALAHRRMTRPYFERWLKDPQRIIPGTPMPQFLIPVPGVEGPLEEQLGAVWDALGNDRLAELASTATRQFLDRRGDRALVVRDMILTPDGPSEHTPRGIAIGLRTGSSLLFDADRLSWTRWWDGGFLYRTKSGRLWEWHPEGRTLWVAEAALPPLVFLGDDGGIAPPAEHRERFGSFSELEFSGDGVLLSYALNGPGGESVAVTERILPREGGWERRVEVDGVPAGSSPLLVAGTQVQADGPGRFVIRSGADKVELRDESGGGAILRPMDGSAPDVLLIRGTPGPGARWEFRIGVAVHPGG